MVIDVCARSFPLGVALLCGLEHCAYDKISAFSQHDFFVPTPKGQRAAALQKPPVKLGILRQPSVLAAVALCRFFCTTHLRNVALAGYRFSLNPIYSPPANENTGLLNLFKRRVFGDLCTVMKKPTLKTLQSGFSLVELLVVIAVIAIIAAIAIPNIANITQSADQATKVRNAQNLASTYNNYAEAYYAQNNSYPADPVNVTTALSTMAAGATVTNTRLGVTNTFRLPGITTNNTDTSLLSGDSGGQLVFTPRS
ncbi:MAG: hypothetical protein Fur0032_21800 [Terrimicrobiaceae bacterium]